MQQLTPLAATSTDVKTILGKQAEAEDRKIQLIFDMGIKLGQNIQALVDENALLSSQITILKLDGVELDILQADQGLACIKSGIEKATLLHEKYKEMHAYVLKISQTTIVHKDCKFGGPKKIADAILFHPVKWTKFLSEVSEYLKVQEKVFTKEKESLRPVPPSNEPLQMPTETVNGIFKDFSKVQEKLEGLKGTNHLLRILKQEEEDKIIAIKKRGAFNLNAARECLKFNASLCLEGVIEVKDFMVKKNKAANVFANAPRYIEEEDFKGMVDFTQGMIDRLNFIQTILNSMIEG